jgi:hypothetical protein
VLQLPLLHQLLLVEEVDQLEVDNHVLLLLLLLLLPEILMYLKECKKLD